MVRHARQVQQQSEARLAFYRGADRGTAKTDDKAPSQWPDSVHSGYQSRYGHKRAGGHRGAQKTSVYQTVSDGGTISIEVHMLF
jgi:hypothetical protein